MNGDDDQLRAILKAMKTVRWTVRVVGGVMLVLASCYFVTSLIELLKAGDSRDWPVVQGRVVSSKVNFFQERDDDTRQERTMYHALIKYSYHVDGTRFQSIRVLFSGRGDSTGTMVTADESDARSVVSRYPQGAAVQVFYNPRDPTEAVLEPGTSYQNRNALIASILSLVVAIVFLLVFRRLIPKFFRGAVAQQAEMYGPQIWEVAGEYGLAPPPLPELEAVTPQSTVDLPFEASERIFLDGQWILLEFSGCLTHIEGDFTGNLDLAVRSSPPLPAETIVENLRLRVSGHDELLNVGHFADLGDRCEVSFHLADLVPLDTDDMAGWQRDAALRLSSVELWWGASDERRLATVSCTHATET